MFSSHHSMASICLAFNRMAFALKLWLNLCAIYVKLSTNGLLIEDRLPIYKPIFFHYWNVKRLSINHKRRIIFSDSRQEILWEEGEEGIEKKANYQSHWMAISCHNYHSWVETNWIIVFSYVFPMSWQWLS